MDARSYRERPGFVTVATKITLPLKYDFFSVGYVKDTLYVSVLQRDSDDLQQNMTIVISLIDMESYQERTSCRYTTHWYVQ